MPDRPYDTSDAFRPPSRKTVVTVVAIVLAVVALGVALHLGSQHATTTSSPKRPKVTAPPTWLTTAGRALTTIDAAHDTFTYAIEVSNARDRAVTVLSVTPLPAANVTVVATSVLPKAGADLARPPPLGAAGVALAPHEPAYVFVRIHVDCTQPVQQPIIGLSVQLRDGNVPTGQFIAAQDPDLAKLPSEACQ